MSPRPTKNQRSPNDMILRYAHDIHLFPIISMKYSSWPNYTWSTYLTLLFLHSTGRTWSTERVQRCWDIETRGKFFSNWRNPCWSQCWRTDLHKLSITLTKSVSLEIVYNLHEINLKWINAYEVFIKIILLSAIRSILTSGVKFYYYYHGYMALHAIQKS